MRPSTQVVLYPVGALKYLIKSPFTKSLFSTNKQNSFHLLKQSKKKSPINRHLPLKKKHNEVC